MEELDMEIVCASPDPNEILKTQRNFRSSGLYFLDIELNADMDGFCLAEEVRKKDPRGFIVFITTHNEFSYVPFERHVEAMDYILKDYPDQIPSRMIECIKQAVDRYSSAENTLQKTLSIKTGGRCIYVPLKEIYCIKSSENKHKIYVLSDNAVHEFYDTLRGVLEKLDSSFFPCHKSCIVNLQYIVEIDRENGNVKLKNGQICPLSSRCYFMLKKRIREYLG